MAGKARGRANVRVGQLWFDRERDIICLITEVLCSGWFEFYELRHDDGPAGPGWITDRDMRNDELIGDKR